MPSKARLSRTVPLALSIVVAAACGDADPVVPDPSAAPVVAEAGERGATPARPLAQRSWGTMMPVGACPGGVRFEAEGEGRAQHVGRFRIELGWCLDPATGVILGGSATVVSQGGEELAMGLGGRAPSPAALSMDATIVGGTGRFVGASGLLSVEVSVEPSGTWASTGSGWISY